MADKTNMVYFYNKFLAYMVIILKNNCLIRKKANQCFQKNSLIFLHKRALFPLGIYLNYIR